MCVCVCACVGETISWSSPYAVGMQTHGFGERGQQLCSESYMHGHTSLLFSSLLPEYEAIHGHAQVYTWQTGFKLIQIGCVSTSALNLD